MQRSASAGTALVLRADWVCPSPEQAFGPGGVEIAEGRVSAVWRAGPDLEGACRRAQRVVELGSALLVHAPINAHAHLELSGLAGRLAPGSPFASWVRGVLAWRVERGPEGLAEDWLRGLSLAAAGGACVVGDIDATGAAWRAQLPPGPWPAVLLHQELLDAREASRLPGQLERLSAAPSAPGRYSALSPHAPQTVSEALLEAVGAAQRRQPRRVQIHWAETREELDWWQGRGGPLRDWLGESPALRPARPTASYLDFLERAGLLGPLTTLVHGNLPEPGEPERLARAGVRLVHCPGSHAFFDRPPFALERYLAAGVPLAIGTDSLASNSSLDMLREVELLARAHPGLKPAQVWSLVTRGGAAVVGPELAAGVLAPGAPAHLLAVELEARDPVQALERLVLGPRGGRRLWIGGLEWPKDP
jgi:cytosine/adenosine deaminase-related metal-dependent hydrolase